jgi:hypothetical protein
MNTCRLILASAAVALLSLPAHAFRLIGDDEARQPAGAGLATRGITRGPAIRQIAPESSAAALKSPLNLKLSFEARGGAKIDPASVRMTYLKATPIDLTERVRHGLSDKGLELTGAEVPPGDHEIQITLQDSEGRKGVHTIRLSVGK